MGSTFPDLASLLTSLDGRINRAKYWIGVVLITLISVIATWGVVALFGISSLSVTLTVLIALALFFPTYALMAKRFQDRDKPGTTALWGLMPIYTINLLLTFSGFDPAERGPFQIICDLIIVGISLWLLVELGILKGTQGPNRYGPDPLGKTRADAIL